MDEINFARLGQIIANALRTQGHTGEEVARAIGIHPVTLSRIVHGKLPGLTVAVLMRLALELDISLDMLTGWTPGKRLREAITQAEREAQKQRERSAP